MSNAKGAIRGRRAGAPKKGGTRTRAPTRANELRTVARVATMPNERTTEDIFRRHIQKYADDVIIEEQTSDDPRIKRALSKASKSGSGVGKPEFIVRLKGQPDFVIVVECKADPAKHVSPKRDKPAQYAVDGALLYSAHLSKDFDVVAIALSGTSKTAVRISTFRQLRGDAAPEPLRDEYGEVERKLPPQEYHRLLSFDSQ